MTGSSLRPVWRKVGRAAARSAGAAAALDKSTSIIMKKVSNAKSAQLHQLVESYSVGASDDEVESCQPTSPDEVWWSEVEEQIIFEEIFDRDPIKRPSSSCEVRPLKVSRRG